MQIDLLALRRPGCAIPFRISKYDRRVMGVVYVTYWHRKKRLGGESVQSVLREGMGKPLTCLPYSAVPRILTRA
ncbi:MAG: hypothetical protein JWQ87_4849 [Candidatus Sulfotelmatobacter sp.]|nr:hypothetical protein [Candidatus Sulfotelmatobacter sp.]